MTLELVAQWSDTKRTQANNWYGMHFSLLTQATMVAFQLIKWNLMLLKFSSRRRVAWIHSHQKWSQLPFVILRFCRNFPEVRLTRTNCVLFRILSQSICMNLYIKCFLQSRSFQYYELIFSTRLTLPSTFTTTLPIPNYQFIAMVPY